MKGLKWLLIGSLTLALAVVFLGGCGGSAEHRDFSSMSELRDWLLENDISEKPATTYAEDWYGRALEVQEDAFADGYIISVDYDMLEDGESVLVWCTAVINGRVFYWDPETDDVFEDYTLGTVE
jgi:hypothetical protein